MQLEEMRMARRWAKTIRHLQAGAWPTAKKKFDGLLDDVDQDLRTQWKVWDEGDEAARGCRAKDDGGAARPAPLPQQSGPRRNRDSGSLTEFMAEGRVVGIDLGTTNSLVAYMQGDKPVVIPGVDGSNLVPSVVALDPIAGRGRPAHGHRGQQRAQGAD